MNLRSALLAATVLAAPVALPVAALAQPVTGPYVAGAVGGSYLQQQDVSGGAVPALGLGGVSGHIRTDVGPLGSLSAGFGFGNGLRVEVQGAYQQNKLTKIAGDNSGGDQLQYGGFVNALYDFDLGPAAFGLTPYVGVGVGYEISKFANGRAYGTLNGQPFYDRITGQDDGVAAQAILGVAYNIDAVPGLALTAEGRFTTMPQDLHYKSQGFAPGVIAPVNIKTNGNYNYAGLIGFRYAFNAAPAPIEPGPAPTPPPTVQARTYLVFFDWDRADLTARARQIIAEAASASTKVQTTRIEVNGYTDLSGTAAYNDKLSVRRAVSVEAELVRDGVPKGEIAIHGYGESNPLVPTAKGVREPQNRRVEIILH